jgi:hypothetical protein
MPSSVGDRLHRAPHIPAATTVGVVVVILSLSTSLCLLFLHRVLSGPGDQLNYYHQAERLIPFTDHFYGPGYFVAIRLVHDLTGADWFVAGKILSWLSACLFLLCTGTLARKLLGRDPGMLVLALVALNPTFIEQSYYGSTIMFGSALILAAITATTLAETARPLAWFPCGLLFGIACLTRFQNNSLFLGSILGTLIMPRIDVTGRITRAACLAAGGFLPIIGWIIFLRHVQESPPENHNFVHLTIALGDFDSFLKVPTIIEKYGSMRGVLMSHWTAPIRIVAFAVKEALKFPFVTGFHLLFLAAGWLLPGLVAVIRRRHLHGPWLGAFLLGLLLTGIGSQGWLHYYTVFVPLAALLIAVAVVAAERTPRRLFRWGALPTSWCLILASTVVWSPVMIKDSFLRGNWTEWGLARKFLEQHKVPGMLVSSTASSLSYGATFPFVDQDQIMQPEDQGHLVDMLRRHNVTHFVVTERHSLYEYPDLKNLLRDSTEDVPHGLDRVLLLKGPKRLAIYQVRYD